MLSSIKAKLFVTNEEYLVGNLLTPHRSVSYKNTNKRVYELFKQYPELSSVAVVKKNKPLGLINRKRFMEVIGKPYGHVLFDRKECGLFIDEEPLIVPKTMSIEELSILALEESSTALADGFIVTDEKGGYLGWGSGEDLVKAVIFLQAEKNRQLSDSISYASIIQKSFFRSSERYLAAVLQDYFLYWQPRDKVGGDYCFCKQFTGGFFIAMVDCTGHGVPGAFMTLITSSFLNQTLSEYNCRNPGRLLGLMNQKLKSELGQNDAGNFEAISQSDDGMSAAFCWVNLEDSELSYAGAQVPLFYIDPATASAQMLPADRKGVGYSATPDDYVWPNQHLALGSGLCLYLTTDGLLEQIGGPKKIAFGKKRFMALLEEHYLLSISEQGGVIMQAFSEYQGKQRRRDDVCLLGFRYP